MVYSVLFVEKDHEEDADVEKLLKRYGDFDLQIIPPNNPIPEDVYAAANSVIVHMCLSRAGQVAQLHRKHPEVGLLVVPAPRILDVHRNLNRDVDGAFYFVDGFTEQDLVDSVDLLSRNCRAVAPTVY